MTRYDVIEVPDGYAYRVFVGDQLVSQSGAFHLKSDADRVGKHWASDKDLMVHLQNR